MTLLKVLLLSLVAVLSYMNGASISDEFVPGREEVEDYDFCDFTNVSTVPMLSSDELLQKIEEINQLLVNVDHEQEKVLEAERDALIAALEASYEEPTVNAAIVAPYMAETASTDDRIYQISERVARIEGMLRSPEVSAPMRAKLSHEQNALRAEYAGCIGASSSSSSNSRNGQYLKSTGKGQIKNWLESYGIENQFSSQFPDDLLTLKGFLDPVTCSSSAVSQPEASFTGKETIDDYLQLILRAFDHPRLSDFRKEFQVELNKLSCILYDLRPDCEASYATSSSDNNSAPSSSSRKRERPNDNVAGEFLDKMTSEQLSELIENMRLTENSAEEV